jgi:hypothetical protein
MCTLSSLFLERFGKETKDDASANCRGNWVQSSLFREVRQPHYRLWLGSIQSAQDNLVLALRVF